MLENRPVLLVCFPHLIIVVISLRGRRGWKGAGWTGWAHWVELIQCVELCPYTWSWKGKLGCDVRLVLGLVGSRRMSHQ